MDNNPATFLMFISLFMKRLQEVAPDILKQPGSHWSAIKPD